MNLALIIDVLIAIPMMFIFYFFLGWEWAIFIGFFFIPIIMKLIQIIDWVLLTSPDAKTIKEAVSRKATAILVAYDDGTHDLQYVTEYVEEGAIKTNKGLIFALMRPKPLTETSPSEMPGANGAPTEQNPNMMDEASLQKICNFLATIKPILRQSRIPILIGYAGKSIATTIEALAAVQGNIFNLTPINLAELKHLFPQMWNISTVRGIDRKAEARGMLKGKKLAEHLRFAMITLLIIAGMGIAAMVVIHFLG